MCPCIKELLHHGDPVGKRWDLLEVVPTGWPSGHWVNACEEGCGIPAQYLLKDES